MNVGLSQVYLSIKKLLFMIKTNQNIDNQAKNCS